jgi:hypothetical protein
MIFLALVKFPKRGAPKLADAASLHPDGRIWSIFTPHTGAPRRVPVCTKDELLSLVYKIVRIAKLSDAEGAELVAHARNWIDVDFTDEEAREIMLKAVAEQIVTGKKS